MTAKLDVLRVLIVDDNAHMLQIVKTILRGFGIKQFYEARSVNEAFEMIRNEPVDFVVVDYLLDNETGLDLVTRVRTSDEAPNPYLPIVMLSAYAERTRVEEARDHGVTEFCVKPVTANELFRKVANVIDHPRPFVRTKEFFGPDRRRKKTAPYNGPARREDDEGDGENVTGGEAA